MVMMTHDKQKLLKYHKKKKDQLYLQENLNSKNCY